MSQGHWKCMGNITSWKVVFLAANTFAVYILQSGLINVQRNHTQIGPAKQVNTYLSSIYRPQYTYVHVLRSKVLATLQLWYIWFLPDWSGQKLNMQFVLLYPFGQYTSLNKLSRVCRQKVPRAYCPKYILLWYQLHTFFTYYDNNFASYVQAVKS